MTRNGQMYDFFPWSCLLGLLNGVSLFPWFNLSETILNWYPAVSNCRSPGMCYVSGAVQSRS
jgi:hypothetical protein